LAEDDGPGAVDEDAALDVPADRSGEDDALDIAAYRGQLGRGQRVVDPGDVLFDDGAGVQLGGHVVRGRADQLHPSLVRLPVWLGAGEAGQERVVNVDHPGGQRGAQARAEDLHVPGQHDQVGVTPGGHLQ
jgi:hypothetical protein